MQRECIVAGDRPRSRTDRATRRRHRRCPASIPHPPAATRAVLDTSTTDDLPAAQRTPTAVLPQPLDTLSFAHKKTSSLLLVDHLTGDLFEHPQPFGSGRRHTIIDTSVSATANQWQYSGSYCINARFMLLYESYPIPRAHLGHATIGELNVSRALFRK